MAKNSFNNFVKDRLFYFVCTSIFIFMLFTGSIFLGGCRVGLGETVDAMAPTLSFVTPGASSVLSEDIKVTGEWIDDKSVKEIHVSVVNTETSAVIIEDELADVNENGTWSYTLFSNKTDEEKRAEEPNTKVLADGKYEISIYAIDVGSHQSGTYSRTFEVDTEPPLVILSKPNSLNIKDATSYGRKIQITGAVSDDHAVESLDIRVWRSRVGDDGVILPNSKDEITLPKSKFTNFDTSDMAVTIAQYWKEPPEDEELRELYDNYVAIYGKDGDEGFDETQNFFIQVTATDKSGNQSERVYAKSKLNSLLKQILADNGITNKAFEPNELKNILNGSYTNPNSLPANVLAEIEDVLRARNAYSNVLSMGYSSDILIWFAFTANSKANPNYALDYKYASGDWSEINKELPVSINLTAGLDGYEIRPDTLKVKLVPVDEKSLKPIEDDKVKAVEVPLTEIFQNGQPLQTGEEVKTTTVSSAKYTFTPARFEDLKAGYCYKVVIEGYDEEDLELYPLDDNSYGFKIQLTASIPEIQAEFSDHTVLEGGEYKKSAEYSEDDEGEILLTVTDEDSIAMNFTASMYVADSRLTSSDIKKLTEADSSLWEILPEFNEITLDEDSVFRISEEADAKFGGYEIPLPVAIPLESDVANYTVVLKIDVEKNGVITSKFFYFYADNQAPSVSLTNSEIKKWNGRDLFAITDEVPTMILDTNPESETYGIFTYTVNGTWVDEYGSGTKYFWWSTQTDDKSEKNKWEHLDEDVAIQSNPGTKTATSWSASFPMLSLEGPGKKIYCYTEDFVGNETPVIKLENIMLDFAAPKIAADNLDDYYGENSENLEILFTAEDTNGIAGIDYEITKNGVPLTQNDFKQSASDVNKIEVIKSQVQTIQLGENEWKTAGYDYKTNKTTKMTLKVSIPRNGNCDGVYKVTVKAKDIAGRESAELSRSTVIDCEKPVFAGSLNVGSKAYTEDLYFNSSILKMSGSYTDSVSGMDSLYYYLKTSDSTLTSVPALDAKDSDGKPYWKEEPFKTGSTAFSITIDTLKDNTSDSGNKLYIRAKDIAGNISEINDFTINIDRTKPTGGYKFKKDDEHFEDIEHYYGRNDVVNSSASENEPLMLEFLVISEDDIRIDAFEGWDYFIVTRKNPDGTTLTIDSEDSLNGLLYYPTEDNSNGIEIAGSAELTRKKLISSVIISADGSGDGEYTIRARAKDDAGNTSDEIKFSFTVDATPPQFTMEATDNTLLNLKVQNSKNWQTRGAASYYKTDALKVEGTATDLNGSGLDTLYYYLVAPGETSAITSATSDLSVLENVNEVSFKNYAYSFTLDSLLDNVDEVGTKVYIQAKDLAGNLSAIKNFTINVDTVNPSITATELEEYYTGTQNASVVFTATDENKIDDIEILIYKNNSTAPISSTAYEANGISVTPSSVTRGSGENALSTKNVTVAFSNQNEYDGKYVITARAKDKAGKYSSSTEAPLTRSTIIDRIAPVYTANSLKVGNAVWNQDSYYKDTTLKMTAGFTDNASGMDTLYYYVQYPGRSGNLPSANDDLSLEGKHDGEPISFKANSNEVSFTVENYLDNTTVPNVIYIQAFDKAGNKSIVTSYTINVDTSAPELKAELYRIVAEGTSLRTASGTAYANGEDGIAVYGSYKDEQSGVRELTFTLAGRTITPEDVQYSDAVITSSTTIAQALAIDWKSYNEITDKKSIKSWRVLFTPTESNAGMLGISGYNKTYVEGSNGGKTSINSFTITMDNVQPVLNNIRLTLDEDKDAYSKTNTNLPGSGVGENDSVIYFINNENDTNLTISGVSTDNTGVDTVSLLIEDVNGNETDISIENSGTAAVWKFEGIDLSSLSHKAYAKVSVTDIAGNIKTKELEIRFDTVAPVSVHELDSKNKDLFFRIGETDNDDITQANASNFYADDENHTRLAWDTSKDTNVGGKYSEGSYGNASTIKIRGNFGDGNGANDSGVKMIYYKVFDHDPTSQEEDAVIALEDITGYFAPLSTVQTKRVFYNVFPKAANESDEDFAQRTYGGTRLMKLEGGQYVPVMSGSNYKYYKNVNITYDSTLSGFKEGNNFVVIVAQDNVGNVGVSSVEIDVPNEEGEIVHEHYRKLTLNVDTVAPTITEITQNDFDKIYVVNSQGKGSDGNLLTISGKVKDDKAGIKSFKVKINETYVDSQNITYDSNNSSSLAVDDAEHTWHVTIPASDINAQTGAIAVYVEAVDNAGTGQSVSRKVASIQVDNTAPSVVVTSTGGWVKNAIENVVVKVNDTNGIKKNSSNNEYVEYKVYASTDTNYATILARGTANVDTEGNATIASINTSDANVFANGGAYIVRFTVKDIVDNTSNENSPLYKVDRTAPVLNDDGDDDDASTGSGVGGVTTIAAVAEKWFDATTLNVSGSFTDGAGSLAEGCGVNKIYYSLNPTSSAPVTGSWSTIDGSYSGNISGFVTGTNTLNLWAEDKLGNTSTAVSYTVKVDTESPTLTSNHTGANAIIYSNGQSAITVSGTVTDGTSGVGAGIKDVKVKVGNNTTLINASKTNGSDWTGGWRAEIPASYLTEGTLPIQAIATDNAGEQGNSSTISVATINIDQTSPVIKIIAPADADTSIAGIQVNGTIQITGTATDLNGIDEVVALYYQISTNNTCPLMPQDNTDAEDSGWIPIDCTITGTNSWTADGINTAKLAGTDGDDIADGSNVYIIAAARDKAGNLGYSQPAEENGDCGLINVIVNQDTDRPVITFTNIEFGANGAPSWIKRSSILYGRVDDDDGNIKRLEYCKKGDGESTWSGWTEITVSSSNAFQLDLGDGSYQILFRVKDAKDTVFALSEAGGSLSPKLVDNKNPPVKVNTGRPLRLAIDKTDPMYDTTSFRYYRYDSTANNGAGAYPTTPSTSIEKLGGKYPKFKMTLKAGDENDVESVKLRFNSSLEFEGTAENTVTIQNGKKYRNWTISDIDITSLQDAPNSFDGTTHNASLYIKDKAGLEVSTTITVTVDNSNPEITVSQPSSSTLHSGGAAIYVQGSVAGSPEHIYFAVSADGLNSPDDEDDVTTWTGESVTNGTLLEDDDSAKTAYIELSTYSGGTSWNINFASENNTPGTKSFNQYLADFGITTPSAIAAENDDDRFESIVNLYVWIKAVDDVGNVTETSHRIQVDPQGDKPTIAFTAPTENNKSMGGTFRLQGTATDPQGSTENNKAIDSVWVQIKSTTHRIENSDDQENLSDDEYEAKYDSAPSYNVDTGAISMVLTKADLAYLVSKGYSVYNMKNYTSTSTPITAAMLDGEGEDDISDDEINDYAILADLDGNTASVTWELDINEHEEFNPTSGTNGLAVRVYARDKDHKISVKQERFLKFDADNPIINNLRVVQSANAALATAATYSKAYSPDMYLKGNWYLTGTVSDKDGINKLQIGNVKLIDNDTVVTDYTAQVRRTDIPAVNGGGESVEFKFALPYFEVGSINYVISAEDKASGTKHTGTEEIKIRCDNKVPEIATTETDGLSISSTIQQNNNWYRFSSVAKEAAGSDGTAQSGFAYTAFYFVRNNTVVTPNTKTLYDVLKARSSAAINITQGVVNLGSEASDADDNTIVFGNGLYWYRKSVSISNGVITFADATGIRKNALVKVGNDFYLVSDLLSATTAQLDGLPLDTSAGETANLYVAIAGIIDNTITEGEGGTIQPDGYYSAPSRDDGDRMIESVVKTGTKWEWEANICSRNIPDGPVSLCYVVFDKVGNHTDLQQVTGTVSNNAPRIAGFTISTDYDGDNQPDETKTNYAAATYSAGSVTTAASASSGAVYDPDKRSLNDNTKHALPTSISIGTAENPIMRVRGLTTIQPEIVGGNGAIYYSYEAENQVVTEDGEESVNPLNGNNSTSPIITEGSIDYTINESAPINIQLGDLLKLGDTDDGIPFTFTFWDSTEGTTKFTTSQHASITTYLAINAQVNNNPTVRIKPFYWNSASSNSLYQNSTANGHIELEADWQNASGYDSTATQGLYDADPKVSGKIVLEGTAHDDKQIQSIKANIFGTEYTVASYSNGALSSSKPEANFGTNNYWFQVVSDAVTANGHDVEWKLYINTAKLLTDVAGTDKTITVIATNKGKPQDPTITASETGALTSIDGTTIYKASPNYALPKSNEPGTSQTTSQTQTAYYKMDVVPYITKIQTANRQKSGLKDNNIRSASGKYSIMYASSTSATSYAANYITVTGFNLNPGANDVRIVSTATKATRTVSNTSGIKVTRVEANADRTSFTTDNVITKSGYFEVFTNGVRSLNNINNNNAYGTAKNDSNEQLTATNALSADYAKAYNREPDYYTTKNVQLTDDRYLMMFDMHTAQTPKASNQWKDLKNAFYPVMVMNGDNPVFGYMNGSGGPSNNVGTARGTGAGTYQPSHAMPQRAEFNGTSGAEVYTEYLIKASAWDAMGMAVDEGGRYYNVTCYNRDKATMSLIYDRYAELYTNGNGWGAGTGYSDYTGSWSYEEGNNAISLDSMNYGDDVLLGRYMYPKIIANGNSKTGTAKVYVAYYDDGTGEIVFRNFQLGTTVSGTARSLDSTHTEKDGTTTYAQKINFRENRYDRSTTQNINNSIAWNTGRLQAVAKGSRYYDMAVTSDNHVVIVYYDEDAASLKLIYSTNAVDGSSPTTTVRWTTSSVSFPDYVGTYCSMILDSDNGIHIAAFDAGEADLKYFYLPGYSSTSLTNLTIDASGSVGHWTGIAICNDTDNTELYGKPVISYYNSTETGSRESIKMAYPKAAIGSIGAGIDSNGYTTGNWEYMTVPSITPPQGGDSKFQKVCLGFDTKGVPVLGFCATNLEFGKQLGE